MTAKNVCEAYVYMSVDLIVCAEFIVLQSTSTVLYGAECYLIHLVGQILHLQRYVLCFTLSSASST